MAENRFILIKARIKKYSLISSIVISLIGSYFIAIFTLFYLLDLIEKQLKFNLHYNFLIGALPTMLFLVFIMSFNPLRKAIVLKANQMVYGEGKHSKVVNEISNALISMLEIRHLLTYLVDSISENLKVEQISIMLLDKNVYKVKEAKNIKSHAHVLKAESELTSWLIKNQNALMVKDLDSSNPTFRDIKKEYKKINAEVVVPVIYKERLIGLINLYKKSTGKYYSEEDISMLESIARTAAIALENARLYEEAVTDSLTGLYHHKYFQARLKEELVQASSYEYPLTLIMLDIDHFKDINDKYGHQIGDQVLKELSDLIKDSVRSSDIVARYGGEEFSIIMTGIQRNERKNHRQNAQRLAQRLRKMVEEYRFSSMRLPLTISIGSAFFDGKEDFPSSESIIKLSDEQLYKAKRTGRNKICFAKYKTSQKIDSDVNKVSS